ncbi:hypothetical protein ACFO25_05095 [Paenactinomyces guangxiensis]|uniref:Uncharacterized protein n=1 Tax=Paenactinomyces guangxiensis TaxID=1490290 RepID=A0A7W1WPX4_9BACL|nr:hypothetical protein [Paenactinomyces guangxiensis]MBA4493754.1 hypothetical protein [Paenactinomyces guangxiensis]MBH8591042.1 hypothetical protein [Paenactinomyces guangxiensis]
MGFVSERYDREIEQKRRKVAEWDASDKTENKKSGIGCLCKANRNLAQGNSGTR